MSDQYNRISGAAPDYIENVFKRNTDLFKVNQDWHQSIVRNWKQRPKGINPSSHKRKIVEQYIHIQWEKELFQLLHDGTTQAPQFLRSSIYSAMLFC